MKVEVKNDSTTISIIIKQQREEPEVQKIRDSQSGKLHDQIINWFILPDNVGISQYGSDTLSHRVSTNHSPRQTFPILDGSNYLLCLCQCLSLLLALSISTDPLVIGLLIPLCNQNRFVPLSLGEPLRNLKTVLMYIESQFLHLFLILHDLHSLYPSGYSLFCRGTVILLFQTPFNYMI